MPLYNPAASYEMQVHLSICTADEKNVIIIKPIQGASIGQIKSRVYLEGVLYKNADGSLQLICPLWIKTVFFIEIKPPTT